MKRVAGVAVAAALLAPAAALLAPAAAGAQQPAAPPVPKLALAVEKALPVGHDLVVLRKRAYRVTGTVAPAVAGQKVDLAIHRNGKRIRTVRATVRADGTFSRRMPTRRQGRFSVRVLHQATPELGAARGPKESVEVVEPRVAQGARGPLVKLLQRSLARLHYAVPTGGTFDAATGRAVMAYRKVNGMSWRYDADRRVIERAVAGKGAFKPRDRGAGRHVEADLSRQVLALIDDGKVVDTYHTSSGTSATPTVIGTFRVYLKTPGTNAKGMVHSSYFIRGYAIHGYVDVPAFNASHGCLRIPIPDASRVFNWLRHGDRVIVYP
jgi:lipoprotein-anchoring transpeptidase ErfK/SrfK